MERESDEQQVSRCHVVIAGWTGSGKSTLASSLSSALNVERRRVSDLLLSYVGDTARVRRDRLLSWLSPSRTDSPTVSVHTDRAIDCSALIDAAEPAFRGIVESVTLPFLLSPINDSLIIALHASHSVRARRIQRIVSELDFSDSLTIVERKDAATAGRIATAWGIELTNTAIQHFRADCVLTCPDELICSDPRACERLTCEIARAVIDVYAAHQNPTSASEAAVQRLRSLRERYPERIIKLTGALTGTVPCAAVQWRHRVLTDLPTEEDACSR